MKLTQLGLLLYATGEKEREREQERILHLSSHTGLMQVLRLQNIMPCQTFYSDFGANYTFKPSSIALWCLCVCKPHGNT